MAAKSVEINELAEKGAGTSFAMFDSAEWDGMITAVPSLDMTSSELRKVARPAPGGSDNDIGLPSRADGKPVCGTANEELFFTALGNPNMSEADRADLIDFAVAAVPQLEHSVLTEHFMIRWTSASNNPNDNILDPELIEEAGKMLEVCWERFVQAFDMAPYIPPGQDKLIVNFYDLPFLGSASPPGGPIKLDAGNWVQNPGLRYPLVAHNLFHKLQYAYGYVTEWRPRGQASYFVEGLAHWAEVFITENVSNRHALMDAFERPWRGLEGVSGSALPFWIFFEARHARGAKSIAAYLEFCRRYGDLERAMDELLTKLWTPESVLSRFDAFFALWCRERLLGGWRDTPEGDRLYPIIRNGETGEILDPVLELETMRNIGFAWIRATDEYQIEVEAHGCDYRRFNLLSEAHVMNVNIDISTLDGDALSYDIIWHKRDRAVEKDFLYLEPDGYLMRKNVDRNRFDAFTVVASGRERGGRYHMGVKLINV